MKRGEAPSRASSPAQRCPCRFSILTWWTLSSAICTGFGSIFYRVQARRGLARAEVTNVANTIIGGFTTLAVLARIWGSSRIATINACFVAIFYPIGVRGLQALARFAYAVHAVAALKAIPLRAARVTNRPPTKHIRLLPVLHPV